MQTNNKQREAVKCLMDNLNIHLMQPSEQITVNRAELDGMVMVCEKALAIPLRNCDVGTPAEQTIRFKKFCIDNRTENDFGCGDCPCYSEDSDTDKCGILWAQMPYESEAHQ